ncbi:MAG: hypothetical protein JRI71_15350 [Deltaproteobacteria bacterium]|nr:hypothetical protein [Deltaproteobacteria bacterium]
MEEANKRLEKARKLSDKDLKGIREAFDKKSRLETSLSAGKLSAKFSPKLDTELEIQKGLDAKVRTEIKGGETLDFQADGRLLASHPEWDLEVISGEVDYSQILAEYEQVKGRIENLLRKLKVKSLEDAEVANAAFKAELTKLENANSNLEEELGELTYEDLKEKVRDLQVKKPQRELGKILSEAADIKAEIKSLKGELTELQEKLLEYAEDFGDHHKLLERLAEVAGARKEKQKALSALKPLPSGIEDADAFIAEYEEVESRLEELKEEHNGLIQERIRLEAKAPDRSVEEIERDLTEAEERFDAELRNGMAVARIKQNMEALLEEMDSSTYKGLETSVSELIQKMTGGRYKEVAMQESVPSGFHREDGVVMPYENLSTGTMDVLGIALRLGITKKFLEEKEGFVIMDDPLVDLDPDRQSKAAEAIKDFAEDKQLIILTCHPLHAEQLGGHQIELV